MVPEAQFDKCMCCKKCILVPFVERSFNYIKKSKSNKYKRYIKEYIMGGLGCKNNIAITGHIEFLGFMINKAVIENKGNIKNNATHIVV